MAYLIWLLGFLIAQPLSVTGPTFPPNAVFGEIVIAEVAIASGGVRDITVLQGNDPFAEASVSALSNWQLQPDLNENRTAVVVFRDPHLYTLAPSGYQLRAPSGGFSLPFPQLILEPSYPPNVLAEGSVILDVHVSETGMVTKVDVLQGLGELTNTALGAVKSWQFFPARDRAGLNTASQAYVVIVFRMPVLS